MPEDISPTEPGGVRDGGENSAGAPDLRTRPLQEQIAELARQIWQRKGRPRGRDEQIWLEAERQILGVGDVVNVGGPTPADALNQAAPPSTAGPGAEAGPGVSSDPSSS